MADEQTPRLPGSPRRSSALIDAIRLRFPGYPHSAEFDAWNTQQAQTDPRRYLTTRLFSDINRGHTPTSHHVSALAAATGWTFEQVSLALGVDFARIPRLHAALGIEHTHIDADRFAFSGLRELPTELAPIAQHDVNAPLNELVMEWARDDTQQWTPDERYVMGRIGRADNIAYPRLPSGAAVLIDRSRTEPAEDSDYYAVEHPNGYSCSRVVLHKDLLTLLSERRDLFPRLEYPIGQVRVHGRIAAFAGRIDRMEPPSAVNLARLLEAQRPILDPARAREMPPPVLLRELVTRLDLPRSRFERKVRMLRRLAGRQFKLSRSHMSGLMQDAELSPRLGTIYALAAILLLQPRELLHAYGVLVGPSSFGFGSGHFRADAEGVTEAAARIARVRAHDGIERLRHDGWDLSWLSSLPRPHGGSQRIYYLGDPGPHLAPLIRSQAFVVVNRRQRRVLTRLYGRPVSELADWMRPIYLLQTTSQRRYLCGYIEDHGDMLHVVPHPDSPTRRGLQLRHPAEAVVVGRVTHVAALLD